MRVLILLASLATIALALWADYAAPRAPATAVDKCALEEYHHDCDLEVDRTLEEVAACKDKAYKEATRIAAGIPKPCR